jgi:hypothetical protein
MSYFQYGEYTDEFAREVRANVDDPVPAVAFGARGLLTIVLAAQGRRREALVHAREVMRLGARKGMGHTPEALGLIHGACLVGIEALEVPVSQVQTWILRLGKLPHPEAATYQAQLALQYDLVLRPWADHAARAEALAARFTGSASKSALACHACMRRRCFWAARRVLRDEDLAVVLEPPPGCVRVDTLHLAAEAHLARGQWGEAERSLQQIQEVLGGRRMTRHLTTELKVARCRHDDAQGKTVAAALLDELETSERPYDDFEALLVLLAGSELRTEKDRAWALDRATWLAERIDARFPASCAHVRLDVALSGGADP